MQVVGTRNGLLFLSILQNLKILGKKNDKSEVVWQQVEKLISATVKLNRDTEHDHDHKALEDMSTEIDKILQSYLLCSQTEKEEITSCPENEEISSSATVPPPPAPPFMAPEVVDPNQNSTLTASFKFKPGEKMRTLNWEKLKKVEILNKKSMWEECAYLKPFLVVNEKDLVDHFCADKGLTIVAAPQTSKVSMMSLYIASLLCYTSSSFSTKNRRLSK